MFKVFDKDAGAYLDLREIVDFDEEDLKGNDEVSHILSYMNRTNPIQPQPLEMDPSSLTMTLSSSKLNSYLKKSNLTPDEEVQHRNTAIIRNRMTQFDTLVLPSHLEETLRRERKTLARLPKEKRKERLTQFLILQNQSWQEWWDIKMGKNQELIRAVKGKDAESVRNLLHESESTDLCADVNFQENSDGQKNTPLHYAAES